jgi:hypothetical protein
MHGPIHGRLFRSELHDSGVRLDFRRFSGLTVEGEISVRLDEHGRPATLAPVIELHNFIFRGPRKTLNELVANNDFNAGRGARSRFASHCIRALGSR